jgi:hypothetical protein
MPTRAIAIASFLFTVAFFIEYTPLARRVHIPFDLEGFHYPLADYAFQALRQGRLPQWDPSIYSGLPLAGNPQAALFYPPSWLMFAAGLPNPKLSYQTLQDFVLAHVWLAFLLCYVWLARERKLHPLAAALGGGVFAFSGYMMLQLQHLGLIAGYAWMPLGFSGIDAASQRRDWRCLWRLVVASAMCLLAGYPAIWIVFAVSMIAYAAARVRPVRGVLVAVAALAASLSIAAIQLLPAWEASQWKVFDPKYGRASGLKDPRLLASYLAPNYFDFGLSVPTDTNPGGEYLYLGAAGLTGVVLLLVRRRSTGLAPPLAVFAASFLFLTNPFGLLGMIIERSPLLTQLFSAWYFLAGLTASVALLAALGLDYGLRRPGKPAPGWSIAVLIALTLAWSVRLLVLGWAGGNRFASGWASALDALVASILLGLLILVFPALRPNRRIGVGLAMIALVAADYKGFGANKRFNAYRGPYAFEYVSKPFPNLDTAVYESMRSSPGYRVALDRTGPFAQSLRHAGLATPQGFDPLLPEQYRRLIESAPRFRTNREFDLRPEDDDLLRLLGVRYFLSTEDGPLFARLSSSPRFRLLPPGEAHYKVFEYLDAQPAFAWEDPDRDRTSDLQEWAPERRAFAVRSAAGGRFRLSEQFYPGWHAMIDGAETAIERCHDAFQCIVVPPGAHSVEFRYRSRWLALGALVSLFSVSVTMLLLRRIP